MKRCPLFPFLSFPLFSSRFFSAHVLFPPREIIIEERVGERERGEGRIETRERMRGIVNRFRWSFLSRNLKTGKTCNFRLESRFKLGLGVISL